MSNSTPTAVTRYRPAILVITGAAAAYLAYTLYNNVQAAPNDGLHRSNAVRRANPQRRPSRTTRIISRLESEVNGLGDYNVLGLRVPFDPHNLITPDDLREALAITAPDASRDTIEVETARMYDAFLDRLLDSGFSNRPLAPAEVEAVTRWVADRLPNSATVSRAVERRTQRLNDARAADADGAESVAGTDISWNSEEDTDNEGIDPDGQTLQRTLYHIAEDRARQEGVVHRGITCNGCDEKPIRGTRWHCANCVDFDLCSNCEASNSHTRTHVFYKIRVPAPYLSLAKQEPLYPGKPHMMHHSVNSALKRRLASQTKMEVEEIEALWDQFTCLASTEWKTDPNKVGWALDRRAFNHAFVPRYNGFVAAPNLIYDRIFTYYDSDKNGLIGFEEWIKGIDGMHSTDMKVKARIVFNGYDIDGDGYISRKDVLRVFRAYYAIEKEATRNFVAELTEELSVRNSMDTVRSSQPLGSAFPPNSLPTPNTLHPSLAQKQNGNFDETSPVVLDTNLEFADRKDVIKAIEMEQLRASSGLRSGERLVEDAWARREFTLDEEEGLTKPDGADDDKAAGSEQTIARRPSRVHFQDEVNHKNWSQNPAQEKPSTEQWGGYEIPELEEDLGQEVLYQITQQAFNELLDPLFRTREDMALYARNSRSERRRHAKAIDVLLEKEKGWGKYNPGILRMGIFRFVKIVVGFFCQHMNMQSFFDNIDPDTYLGNHQGLVTRIHQMIGTAEQIALSNTVKLRSDDRPLDGLSEWSAELFRKQLYVELEHAVIRLLNPLDETTRQEMSQEDEAEASRTDTDRDPTMPQFRPNSLAEIETTMPVNQVPVPYTHISSLEVVEDLEDFLDDEGRICLGAMGPFFVAVRNFTDSDPSLEEEQAERLTTPTATPPPGIDFRDSEGRPVPDVSDSPAMVPATPRPSRDFSEAQEPGQAPTSPRLPLESFKAPHVTNTPWLQTLSLTTGPDGSRKISYTRRHIAHLQSAYAINPEPDQTAALIANLRHSAKNPDSPLYTRLLASCEAVEAESRVRRGDGLLSFDEFEEVLKDGRLRFLESWMDWVSL